MKGGVSLHNYNNSLPTECKHNSASKLGCRSIVHSPN